MEKSFKKNIQSLEELFLQAIKHMPPTLEALEQIRIDFLGKNSTLHALMKELKNVSLDEKKECGPALNELKKKIEETLLTQSAVIKSTASSSEQRKKDFFDVTACIRQTYKGSLHIYTQLIQELEDIFISMGYEIKDGNEVETDYYNFSALNIPNDHPARDMHDTFWLNVPGMLLRTHTSTIQAHAMEENKPPLAVFAPGRCYRNEATDATHEFMFTQAEVLFVDKNVSIANLLATARQFIQIFFKNENIELRVRPGYFPFVEPGLEIDASCPFCNQGCSICKKTGWIELLGSGLVHPNVLQACGIDPTIYSAFAFGFGIERLAMIKYGITDIRLFHNGKINFLEQF